MAFDYFMNFGDIKGESTDLHKDGPDLERFPATTVQLGENQIGQVADRLGMSKESLLQANPQLVDPSNLKVGQEIYVPRHPIAKSEGSAENLPKAAHTTGLPKPPIGDPLSVGFMRRSLEMASTSARMYADNAKIDGQKKEAQQKFDNAMEAAATQMALGVSAGVAAPGSQSSGTKMNQALEPMQGSTEYVIAAASALQQSDARKNIEQEAQDLAKLEGAKLQRLTSDDSKTEGASAHTGNRQDSGANQGLDRRRFIKP